MNKYVITQVNVHTTGTKPVEKKLGFGVLAEKSGRRILSSFVKSVGLSHKYDALSHLNPLTSIYR
jgi:hypothetical protein